MHRTAALIIVSVLLVLQATGLSAQPEATAETTVQEQLAQLNSTMQEIASLLERQLEGNKTNLLIKRIELANRSLVAKKERLRKLRSEAANLDEKEGSLARTFEASEEQLSQSVEDDSVLSLQMEQLKERLKSVAGRQRELEREIIVLENQVRTGEEDMEMLEAVLDERLDLR